MDTSYYTTLEEKMMEFIETMEKYLLHACGGKNGPAKCGAFFVSGLRLGPFSYG